VFLNSFDMQDSYVAPWSAKTFQYSVHYLSWLIPMRDFWMRVV